MTRRRFHLPPAQRDALARCFDVTPDTIDAVRIVERSRFARLHGRHVVATTRRGTIYVAGAGRDFVTDSDLLLHEYFHVLRQWNTGTLTVWRYVTESLKRGYRSNGYEVEARRFAHATVQRFAALLRTAAVASSG